MEFNNLLQMSTERRPETEQLNKSWSNASSLSSLSDEWRVVTLGQAVELIEEEEDLVTRGKECECV